MFELDPDLRLCARLYLGRGQRRAGILLAWTAATAFTGYNIFHFTHLNEPAPPGLLSPALAMLFLGPGITTLRLAAGAFVAAAALVASVRLTPIESVATGAAAALAVCAGILVHELLRRGPLLSLVARMAIFAGVLRLAALLPIGTPTSGVPRWVPPTIQLADLAALSALAAALAIAHSFVRTRADDVRL